MVNSLDYLPLICPLCGSSLTPLTECAGYYNAKNFRRWYIGCVNHTFDDPDSLCSYFQFADELGVLYDDLPPSSFPDDDDDDDYQAHFAPSPMNHPRPRQPCISGACANRLGGPNPRNQNCSYSFCSNCCIAQIKGRGVQPPCNESKHRDPPQTPSKRGRGGRGGRGGGHAFIHGPGHENPYLNAQQRMEPRMQPNFIHYQPVAQPNTPVLPYQNGQRPQVAVEHVPSSAFAGPYGRKTVTTGANLDPNYAQHLQQRGWPISGDVPLEAPAYRDPGQDRQQRRRQAKNQVNIIIWQLNNEPAKRFERPLASDNFYDIFDDPIFKSKLTKYQTIDFWNGGHWVGVETPRKTWNGDTLLFRLPDVHNCTDFDAVTKVTPSKRSAQVMNSPRKQKKHMATYGTFSNNIWQSLSHLCPRRSVSPSPGGSQNSDCIDLSRISDEDDEDDANIFDPILKSIKIEKGVESSPPPASPSTFSPSRMSPSQMTPSSSSSPAKRPPAASPSTPSRMSPSQMTPSSSSSPAKRLTEPYVWPPEHVCDMYDAMEAIRVRHETSPERQNENLELDDIEARAALYFKPLFTEYFPKYIWVSSKWTRHNQDWIRLSESRPHVLVAAVQAGKTSRGLWTTIRQVGRPKPAPAASKKTRSSKKTR
ncbi:hypothetical protein C8J56DRAFT_63082 [Mycena floridula]|nr:hypothetical protein C8J56DRAFT_63082 [Mycena floridula]